jgi:hypothetical protein
LLKLLLCSFCKYFIITLVLEKNANFFRWKLWSWHNIDPGTQTFHEMDLTWDQGDQMRLSKNRRKRVKTWF